MINVSRYKRNLSGDEIFRFVRELLRVEEEVATNRRVYGGFYPRGGEEHSTPITVNAMGSTASSSRSSADEREEPPRRRQADRRNASNSPPRYSRRSRGKRDNREGKGGKGGSQKPPNSIKSSSSAQVAQNSVQPNPQYHGKGVGDNGLWWAAVGRRVLARAREMPKPGIMAKRGLIPNPHPTLTSTAHMQASSLQGSALHANARVRNLNTISELVHTMHK